MQDLGVELSHQRVQFVDRVQDLDALGVWVESDLEGARHGGHPATELLLGVLEALGHIVDGLVLLVLVRLQRGGCGVEGAQLGLVADGVQELTVGRQETGSVRLDFAIFLAQAELDSEPVDLWGSNERETPAINKWCPLNSTSASAAGSMLWPFHLHNAVSVVGLATSDSLAPTTGCG